MDTYSINPVIVRMKESEKGTIYQSIVALGIRARDINEQIRAEIHARLADVIVDTETDVTNYDQIAISKEFDHLLKPTFFAMKEIMNGKLKIELASQRAQAEAAIAPVAETPAEVPTEPVQSNDVAE